MTSWRARRAWGPLAAVVVIAAGLVTETAGTTAAAPPAPGQATGPTITVTPAVDLVDGTQVSIEVTGLRPGSWYEIQQCPVGFDSFWEDCDGADYAVGEADENGSAHADMRLDLVIQSARYEEPGAPPPVTTDCRAAGACTVAVSPESSAPVSAAPLQFRPDAEPTPPPVATVTPEGPLGDLQTVTVRATGLVWSDSAELAQCAANPTTLWDDCQSSGYRVEVTDGELIQEHQVDAIIATGTHGQVDCRVPGSCVLVATQSALRSPGKTAVVPLVFDPDTQVTQPTLTVTPDRDLVDGQSVTVQGSGFAPGRGHMVLQCAPESSTEPPAADECRYTPTYIAADDDGNIHTELPLDALLTWWPESSRTVDCRTATVPCQVLVSPGTASSPRAGRADLHFDPDAPLLPGPEIQVEPSTDLRDGQNVTVTGQNFRPDAQGNVQLCVAGGDVCDAWTSAPVEPDAEGNIAVELSVTGSLSGWDGQTTDCRIAPGCEVVAHDYTSNRRAAAPITFAPPDAGGDDRYLDPVFESVDVTRDVVYRDTVDAAGNPVQLRLDVYEPAGDTATKRPAVVLMHGGPDWFGGGGKSDMAGYAEDFARRGYVAVSLDYRLRPELACCPTDDAIGVTEALVDGYEDAAAGVAWLRQHAEDYRIDPEAIVTGGSSAGAANAYSLANIDGQHPDDGGHGEGHEDGGHDREGHDSGGHEDETGEHGHGGGSAEVAAALPIAGVSLGRFDAGEAPVLAFHGSEDQSSPLHLSEWACDRAEAVDVRCETVSYAGAGQGIATSRRADIVHRSTGFLAEVVLEPLGYLPDDPGPDPTTPTTHGGPHPTHGTSTTHGSPTTHGPGTTHGSHGGGTSTTQGSHGGGTSTTHGGGHGKGTGGNQSGGGSGRLASTGSDVALLVGAGLALVALGALLLFAARARGRLSVLRLPRLRRLLLTAKVRARLSSLRLPPRLRGHRTRWITAGLAALVFAAVTVPGSAASPGDDHGAHDDPGHEDPGHDPGHGDPGFPDDWTPEQVAYAENLIADTEATLPRFANQAILPLLGFVWIFDGTEPETYQHWIQLSSISDQLILDPERPESLVFRNDADDGPVLESAMYILPLGHTLTNIPPDIRFLPDWHIHDNLCMDSSYRIVGLAVDGVCERGFLVIPPPMLHVWIVDTRCGRFAGVDEEGLQCHHEHDAMP